MSGTWPSRVVGCPRCGGALVLPDAEAASSSLVRCAKCGPYPCLAGVPVLVSDPFGYCRALRDSILATLAEHDAADRVAVAVVDAFSRGARSSEVFADDWTEHEAAGQSPPRSVKGPSAASLTRLQAESARHGPGQWIASRVPKGGTVLEIGCGAGERSVVLAQRAERVLIADRSLRAVLQARRRASGAGGGGEVAGVVLDAEALALRPRGVDVVVAEHLVDLLDEPRAFFEAVRSALKRGGRLLVTTPDPSLGTGDDDALTQVAREMKWRVAQRRDGLPWLRVNSARFVEVYLVQALDLR